MDPGKRKRRPTKKYEKYLNQEHKIFVQVKRRGCLTHQFYLGPYESFGNMMDTYAARNDLAKATLVWLWPAFGELATPYENWPRDPDARLVVDCSETVDNLQRMVQLHKPGTRLTYLLLVVEDR